MRARGAIVVTLAPVAIAIACAAKREPAPAPPPTRPVESVEPPAPTDAGFVLYDDAGLVPTPEQTCDKLQELTDKENNENADSGRKPFVLNREKCLENMVEIFERDRSAYICAARVIPKLAHLDTAFSAIGLCDKNKPKAQVKHVDDVE